MILTGSAIDQCVNSGEIVIEPYNSKNLNPNSYNFQLGDYVLVYKMIFLTPKNLKKRRK